MPDYKEMYSVMVRATEQAIRELVNAQRYCEELYLEQTEDEDNEEESETPLPRQGSLS